MVSAVDFRLGDIVNSPLLIDDIMRESLHEALAFTQQSHRIWATILFGSIARDQRRQVSDVDVIYLAEQVEPRGHIYCPQTFGKFHFDVNIATIEGLNTLLWDSHWQYRLADAVILDAQADRRSPLEEWLCMVKAWIRQPEAQFRRSTILTSRLRVFLQWMRDHAPHPAAAESHLVVAAAWLGVLLRSEQAGFIPFVDNDNPEMQEALADFLDQLPFDTRPADNPGTKEKWGRLKKLKDGLRREIMPFAADAAAPCEQMVMRLPGGLPGNVAAKIDEWCQAMGWNPGGNLDCVAMLSDLCANPFHGLELLPAASLRPLVRRGYHFEYRTSKADFRVSAYDPERRRLKVILPTGGCRVPACTFCALPNLAHPAQPWILPRVAISGATDIDEIAIFTDGSFFDDAEVNPSQRETVAVYAKEIGARSLLVETLPRFLTEEKLQHMGAVLKGMPILRIGVGVQTLDARVRSAVLGTPIHNSEIGRLFSLRDIWRFRLRIYLLFGKPLRTRAEEYSDLKASLRWLAPRMKSGDVITINRLLVTEGTAVASLCQLGLYAEANICALRRFIVALRSAHPGVAIIPGAIDTTTCTTLVPPRSACRPCYDWLRLAEHQNQIGAGTPCTASHSLPLDLPWPIFGGVENRCAFAVRISAHGRMVNLPS